MNERFNALKADFYQLLSKIQIRVQEAEKEEDLEAICTHLETIPPVIRSQLRRPGELSDIQVQMARTNERMEKIIRQPSISTLPPAGRHFREASTKLSHIGKRTK